jgi:hypothetical protein
MVAYLLTAFTASSRAGVLLGNLNALEEVSEFPKIISKILCVELEVWLRE